MILMQNLPLLGKLGAYANNDPSCLMVTEATLHGVMPLPASGKLDSLRVTVVVLLLFQSD